MKLNELMVGDWYAWEAEGKLYYYQVTKETFSSPDYDVYNFQPIHITTENLEKNGFTKGGILCKAYYLAVGDFEIYVYFAHANTQLIIEKRNGKEIINILNVEYIHILQHAFRLCGIEKDIEL
jgi:hypothetical protein